MPDYQLTLTIIDSEGSTTTKTHFGTFADQATAETARDDLVTDYDAAMDGKVIKSALAVVEEYATATTGGRTIFRRGSITLSLVAKSDKSNFKVPAVNSTINPTKSSVNLAATPLTNLIANFQAGGGWTISDGDVVNAIVDGKAVFDKSGENF